MKVRHVVAVSMIGIVGAFGALAGAGVAVAQTTNPPNTSAVCVKATARLPKIQDRITKVEARIATLQARLATAQSNNRTDRVQLIQGRIDWSNTVRDHLTSVVSQITARCGTT